MPDRTPVDVEIPVSVLPGEFMGTLRWLAAQARSSELEESIGLVDRAVSAAHQRAWGPAGFGAVPQGVLEQADSTLRETAAFLERALADVDLALASVTRYWQAQQARFGRSAA